MLRYEASSAVRSRHLPPPSRPDLRINRAGVLRDLGPSLAHFSEAVYLSGCSEALHRIPRRMAEGGNQPSPGYPNQGLSPPLLLFYPPGSALLLVSYSTECVEGKFSNLRTDGSSKSWWRISIAECSSGQVGSTNRSLVEITTSIVTDRNGQRYCVSGLIHFVVTTKSARLCSASSTRVLQDPIRVGVILESRRRFCLLTSVHML